MIESKFDLSKLKMIDAMIFLYIISWIKVWYNLKNNSKLKIENKHDAFLLITMYNLQIIYYMIALLILIVVLIYIFKFVIIDMIMPISIDTLLMRIFKFIISRQHILFITSVIGLTIAFDYVFIILYFDEKNKDSKHHLIRLLESSLFIFLFCYVIFIVSNCIR